MELPSADSGNTVNGTVSTAFDIKFGGLQAWRQGYGRVDIWIQASGEPGGPGMEDTFESNIKAMTLDEITIEMDLNN